MFSVTKELHLNVDGCKMYHPPTGGDWLKWFQHADIHSDFDGMQAHNTLCKEKQIMTLKNKTNIHSVLDVLDVSILTGPVPSESINTHNFLKIFFNGLEIEID